jgi:hypothetical protein
MANSRIKEISEVFEKNKNCSAHEFINTYLW